MKSPRITYMLAALLVVAGMYATFLPTTLYALPRAGQPAPPFKVITTSGQQVTLENYRGYVLVLDFFATWCQPCRESVPHLIEMNRQYGKQGLQILGLGADEDGEKLVKAFASDLKITYPVAVAGETVLTDYGVRSVPVMMVIDRKGKIAEIFRGANDEIKRSAEKLIKKLLAEK